MAGYSGTPLAKKLGIKPNMQIYFHALPSDVKKELKSALAEVKIINRLGPDTDFIHVFVSSQTELKKSLPKWKSGLSKSGSLWVSWPKKISNADTDLSGDIVREIGLDWLGKFGYGIKAWKESKILQLGDSTFFILAGGRGYFVDAASKKVIKKTDGEDIEGCIVPPNFSGTVLANDGLRVLILSIENETWKTPRSKVGSIPWSVDQSIDERVASNANLANHFR